MMKTIALTIVALTLVIFAGCGEGPPAAPANLTATATTSTTVSLSWDSVLAATSYNVYRRKPTETFLLLAPNITTTTYTDTPTTAATTYFYQVTAVNWNVESAASNVVTVTTP